MTSTAAVEVVTTTEDISEDVPSPEQPSPFASAYAYSSEMESGRYEFPRNGTHRG